jgi:hypothetical protein
MGWVQWTVGWVLFAAQVGACVAAGRGLRRRLVPSWHGVEAAMATTVSALAVLIGSALALGTAGLLRQWSLPLALVVAAVALDPAHRPWRLAERRVATSERAGRDAGAAVADDRVADDRVDDDAVDRSETSGGTDGPVGSLGPYAREARWARFVALGVAALVAAGWVERVAAVYRRGMTDGDSLMYHLPFAARFVQSGWTTGAEPVGPDAWVAFYPANVEVLQASVILPFGSDVLVPLMNLGWLALALAAAWSIGAAAGRASLGLVLGTVVMATPIMPATQGGTARVDAAAVALVLAAVAVVIRHPVTAGSCTVGGLALGLAVGSKLVIAPLAGALLVSVAAAVWRRHGIGVAGAWCGAAALGPLYWFVRNWAVAGSPVPAIDLRVGPVGFAPLPEHRRALLDDSSIVANLERPGFWGNVARPVVEGFTGSAVASLAVVGVAAAAIALVMVQRPVGVRHAVAASALVGCVAYLFVPYSAPIRGDDTHNPLAGLIVGLNVRYLLPALAVALCLLAVGLPRRARASADVLLVALALVAAIGWWHGRNMQAEWPTGTADALVGGAVAVTAAVVLLVVATVASRRRSPRDPVRVAGAAAAVLAAVGAVAVSAWVAADRSGLHDYAAMPPEQTTLWQTAGDAPGDHVALLADWVQYPLMGPELDKSVDYVGVPHARGLTAPPRNCDEVGRALAEDDYDIAVVQVSTFRVDGSLPFEFDCLLADAEADLVLQNEAGAVFGL